LSYISVVTSRSGWMSMMDSEKQNHLLTPVALNIIASRLQWTKYSV